MELSRANSFSFGSACKHRSTTSLRAPVVPCYSMARYNGPAARGPTIAVVTQAWPKTLSSRTWSANLATVLSNAFLLIL